MKIEIRGQPEFSFVLSDDQWRMLHRLADAHYDSVCRAAFHSEHGELKHWFSIFFPRREVRATFRQLDLACKILEGREFQKEYLALGGALAWDFGQALKLSNEHVSSWQVTYLPRAV